MVALPSGFVTFVFTDIEGSTRLFRRIGDRYPGVLERHNELLRGAWRRNQGVEVKTEGDAFFVAFDSAASAVAACVDAQRSLRVEPWPPDAVVKVRMGVHSGLAAPKGGDYIAYAVHQAARIVGAGHGGQILLSADTVAAAGEVVAAACRSLGHYRVRDFDAPIELSQVTGEGLEQQFPSPRATPAEGHNLVRPGTTFFGRGDDLAEIEQLLGPSRLVSLLGPGGVGKTRTAVEVGLAVGPQWRDGTWVVELASLTSDGLVAGATAEALGVTVGNEPPLDALVDDLQQKNTLVMLDNCEHVLDEAAGVVAEILRHCPAVGFMATSREPLGLGSEVVWRLGSLASDAIDLFIDRAVSTDARFDPDEADVDAIAAVCDRLDGLPLAIELAAARTDKLRPAEILAGLDDRLRLPRSRRRDIDERQRSLTALLDWSHDLLDEDEQAIFRRLAVFADSFTIEAAEAVTGWGSVDPYDVAEIVWALVDKSLAIPDSSDSQTRYRFLDTVRAYAADRLRRSREQAGTAVRASDWLLGPLGPRSVRDVAWLHDTRLELDNIRGLIELVADHAPERGQRLACSVALLLDAEWAHLQGTEEIRRYLQVLPQPSSERLGLLGSIAHMHVQLMQAIPDDVSSEAQGLLASGVTEPGWARGRLASTEALALYQAHDFETCVARCESALAVAVDPAERSRWVNLLGIVRVTEGKLDEAVSLFEAEVELARQLGDQRLIPTALGNLAEAHLRLGHGGLAARFQLDALETGVQVGLTGPVAFSLIVAARLLAADGVWEDAVALQSAADVVLDEQDIVLYETDRELSDELLAEGRRQIGESRCRELRAAAPGTSIDEAVRMAQRALGPLSTAASGSHVSPLAARRE